MFVRGRKGKARGQVYYQLVQVYRDTDGKARQETTGMGISATVAEAIESERHALRVAKRRRSRLSDDTTERGRSILQKEDRAIKVNEARIAKFEEAQRLGID